jgi:DNA-binding response OmpR family regulator
MVAVAPLRLLIIEDYALLRDSLARGLRDLGYAVDVAADGKKGLSLAESHPHDVIILDIMLPGIDGLEVLRRLRSASKSVPVLVLTARGAVDDRVTALDGGADDYLVKPFAFEELAARVRALLRRRYDRADPIVRVADLELDLAKRTVRRGDRVVQLSAREFALLEYLASRPGEVVPRADLLGHVYEADGEPWSNVLDVYISHLRRKIDDGYERKLIHTRRGQGYMLGDEQ